MNVPEINNQTIIMRPSLGNLIFSGVMGFWFFAMPFFYIPKIQNVFRPGHVVDHRDIYFFIFLTLVCLFFCLVVVIPMFGRIEFWADRVIYVGLFNRKEILYEDLTFVIYFAGARLGNGYIFGNKKTTISASLLLFNCRAIENILFERSVTLRRKAKRWVTKSKKN